MPISKAWKLCPEAVYLKPNFPLYVKISEEIMDTLRGYADKFEQWGIDEAFLDITSRAKDMIEAEALARRMKQEFRGKHKLTCSIGIGPNKVVAKIASDFQKPDGLTIVKEEEAAGFLAPLPVRKLLWVGKKTERKLNSMGVKTIGDLANYDPTILTETFGVVGTQMLLMARGIDTSRVEERSSIKSMSRETTFEEDTSDPEMIMQTLDKLSEQVHEDVVTQKVFFKNVAIKVRYENFETHTRAKTLPFLSDRMLDIQKTAKELMQYYMRSDRKIRLLGVRVSSFVAADKQKTLF
jgi:DNA polymerase IV (DinB-like DNA polymerase)